MYRILKFLLALTVVIAVPLAAHASSDYIGEKECYACHKQVKNSFLESRHGHVLAGAPRTDMEAKVCEACHGPGSAHKEVVDREEKGPMKIEAFKEGVGMPSEKSARCLECHEKDMFNFWRGSAHDMGGVNCASCHNMHTDDMKVTMDVCFRCHPQARAQMQRSSHMPLRENLMTCNDCHNPHGGPGPFLLKTATVNETCYECHEDKRGPFLWEHAPARDDCSLCHEAHGSNQESLLKIRVPYLCQGCHDTAHHPSSVYDGTKVASGSPAQQLLGRGCLNCHTQVHGTNHPSGARFTR